MTLRDRLAFAEALARKAGAFARQQFEALDTLTIESKGLHDLVSQADRDTETLIRTAISEAFPDDGIVGEEHGREAGTSAFDWVIDPIDGTANFVSGIPHWCVVIACTQDGLPVVGVIYDPNTGELFKAAKGLGAAVNDRPMRVNDTASMQAGSIGVGASGRSDPEQSAGLVRAVLVNGGMFFRSASGALMLAYVAAGRLIGYVESHMHAWDCYAALIIIEEAGGRHQGLDAAEGLAKGTRIVTAGPALQPRLDEIVSGLMDA